MKSTNRNFPDSLLQQYNFDTNTTSASVEANEEATATDEPEAEAAAEPQVEVESEDTEPSDQPEKEGDKSATNSSPTEQRKIMRKNVRNPQSRLIPNPGKGTLSEKRKKRNLKRSPPFQFFREREKKK